jgi:Membrane bound O-acyl transferase family
MTTVLHKRAGVRFLSISAWWAAAALPTAFAVLFAREPRWTWMWAFAFGIYAGLKWLSFVAFEDARCVNRWRSAVYLLLWPGMDAAAFLDSRGKAVPPSGREWILAAVKVAFGLGLLIWVVPGAASYSLFAAGWIGISALCVVLHFGLFDLLSLAWRQAGIKAIAIMNAPSRAVSLSEFWGRRWNLAFRDLAHAFVFRPLVGTWGPTTATIAVFVVSGVIHDLVISGAARAGFGEPTLYFLIQAACLFIERSRLGRRIGFGRGWVGWTFCAIVTIGPVGLLFHRSFIERVAVPMFQAFGLI